jgi:hypothetical protein
MPALLRPITPRSSRGWADHFENKERASRSGRLDKTGNYYFYNDIRKQMEPSSTFVKETVELAVSKRY